MSVQAEELWRILRPYYLREAALLGGVGAVVITPAETLEDHFADTGGREVAQLDNASLRWLQLASFEPGEGWVSSGGGMETYSQDHVKEGDYSFFVEGGPIIEDAEWIKSFDFSTAEQRFGDNDYIRLDCWLSVGATIHIRFMGGAPGYFDATFSGVSGWNHVFKKRSDFVPNGAPNWASVDSIVLFADAGVGSPNAYYDNLQVIKADPDDAATYNATGYAWDFFGGGVWTILQDVPGVPFALAQLKSASGVRYTALKTNTARDGVARPYQIRRDFTAAVLLREDGKAGIWWGDGPDDCYQLSIDTGANEIKFEELAGGSVTATHATITPSPALANDTPYYLGLRRDGSQLTAYVTTQAHEMFQALARIKTITDTTYATGLIGFANAGANARCWALQAGSPEFALTAGLAMAALQMLSTGQAAGAALLANGMGGSEWGQALDPTASPTLAGLTLSGLTASRLLATSGAKALASVADLTAWIAGTANRVTVANDGDGTITLNGPQDLHSGANPTFAAITINSSKFSVGTSFPGSPAAGDLCWRTDLGFLCRYDGSRWRTIGLSHAGFPERSALGVDAVQGGPKLRTDYAPYIPRVSFMTRVNTTNNGSNYWTITMRGINDLYNAATTIYAFNTSTHTAGVVTVTDAPPSTPNPSNRSLLDLDFKKTGSPGSLDLVSAMAHYDLIVPS